MKRYNPDHSRLQGMAEDAQGTYVLFTAADIELQTRMDEYMALKGELARKELVLAQLRQGLETLRRSHYVCEDCWYSCPESGECCDERQTTCNCGASDHNAKIDALLAP